MKIAEINKESKLSIKGELIEDNRFFLDSEGNIHTTELIEGYSLKLDINKKLYVNEFIEGEDLVEFEETPYLAQDSDFSGTTDGTFKYIGTSSVVEIPHVIKGIPITSYANMFQNTDVTKVVSDNPNVTNIRYMFYGSKATSLDLSSFDTSNVTTMSYMFYGSKATSLDLSSFDTSNVTNMSDMFSNSQASSLDLSSFDTSNVTDMEFMFYGSKATSLDLSNFDTSNVTNIRYMFYGSQATTGYARTQADADKLNSSTGKPTTLNFIVKE